MTGGRPAPNVAGRVLVTGAAGFIGRALAIRLRELGTQVRGVDLRPDPAASIVAGSTVDPQAWATELAGVDAVVHLAALVSTVAPLDAAWEVNVLGTARVLEAARAAGVRRVVHVSSVAAYGLDTPPNAQELQPLRPSGGLSTYTDTKIAAEHVALAASGSGQGLAAGDRPLEVVVVRPTDVYGPGSVWIREPLALARAGLLVLPDGGRGLFNPVYVDNLVDGLVLALATDGIAGQIVNLGDGRPVPCREYFGRVAAMAGRPVRTLPFPLALGVARGLGGLQRRLGRPTEMGPAAVHLLHRSGGASIDKAVRVLGYRPLVDLDEGLRRSESWARAEGLL